jgi:ABC-type Mn2+/Zn2+ transport system permease subunit
MMAELLGFGFFRNALAMCVLLGLLFGTLSFFVVTRKLSFLGAGISHSAFGGVAIGVALGVDPFVTALVFCLAVALSIGRLSKWSHISHDAEIGIFFSLSMALGVILIALKKTYTFDLSGYLFGNILAVTRRDLWVLAGALAMMIPLGIVCFHRLLFLIFDEEAAEVSGVPVDRLNGLLLAFLAVAIVIGMKIVGIILVSALLVLPASFGLACFRDWRRVMIAAVLFAVFTLIGGLFLSYWLNSPAGATMVALGSAVYFGTLLIQTKMIRGVS